MRNSDITNPNLVYCRSCIHRKTENCPLLERVETYGDDTGFDYYFIDHAQDGGFCWLGERDEEAEEAEFRHNEYNNFLTSIMNELE